MSNESSSEPQWAAYAAIDWADREHVWNMQPAENGPCESGKVEQTPEAIEIWASQLATRFNGRPIAVALEQSRGPSLRHARSGYSGPQNSDQAIS